MVMMSLRSRAAVLAVASSRRAAPVRLLTQQLRFVQQQSNVAPAAANATSTAAAAAAGTTGTPPPAAKEAGAGPEDEEAPKYKPGWFSRNPGVTLGSILLAIALYIYRGSKNKKNFEALQSPIAEEAVISPYEAWELRSSNSITPETYEAVREGVARAFPSHKATMEHFDQYLGIKLVESCPQGLHKAHHLERLLLSLPRDENKKCDVDALMVAFSMAVQGATDERLQCLYNLATDSTPPPAAPVSDEEDQEAEQPQVEEHEPQREISGQEFERLLELLLQTYQIPSEKRVLPVVEEKYPFQVYKPAEAHDLLQAAVQEQVDAKKISSEEANARQSYTFEAFSQLMRGKTVCLWGECFANLKKKMKN